MKISIPLSLYNAIKNNIMRGSEAFEIRNKITYHSFFFEGKYGAFEIEGIPDEDYCVSYEVMTTAYHYKETK